MRLTSSGGGTGRHALHLEQYIAGISVGFPVCGWIAGYSLTAGATMEVCVALSNMTACGGATGSRLPQPLSNAIPVSKTIIVK